jgi:DNA-binding NarL/FixJ family response regulator
MRVLVVGTRAERADLRACAEPLGIDILGEFDTVGLAQTAGLQADGILIAPPRPDPDGLVPVETLTARESAVLDLLAQGLSNKAIAARLGISDQTVKFHVSSIAGKLGASNRTDAVRRAVRRGLVAL